MTPAFGTTLAPICKVGEVFGCPFPENTFIFDQGYTTILSHSHNGRSENKVNITSIKTTKLDDKNFYCDEHIIKELSYRDVANNNFLIKGLRCKKSKTIDEGSFITLLLSVTYTDKDNKSKIVNGELEQRYFSNKSSKEDYDKEINLINFKKNFNMNWEILSNYILLITAIVSLIFYFVFRPVKKVWYYIPIVAILTYFLVILIITILFGNKVWTWVVSKLLGI